MDTRSGTNDGIGPRPTMGVKSLEPDRTLVIGVGRPLASLPVTSGALPIGILQIGPTHPLQTSVEGTILLVAMFGLGLLMIYSGFNEYRVGRLIRNTSTETVRGAAVGRTELAGRVKPAETTLAQPFGDGECVYALYRIQEEREDSDGDTSWATLDHDIWVTDFYLDDGTGEILIEPEVTAKFEISDGNTTVLEVPGSRSTPSVVAEFLEQGTDVEPTSRDTRRYVQTVLPPGEEVYVLGGAEIRSDGTGREAENLIVRRDASSDRFVISDMPEERLTTTLSRRAPLQIAFGLLLSAVSLYLLLTHVGAG